MFEFRHRSAIVKIGLPLLIILLALAISKVIGLTTPEPESRPAPVSVFAVDATRLKPSQYPVVIRTQGTVQPTLANTLVPSVAGAVTQLSDLFVAGGAFDQGEILMQLDSRDYDIALTQAEANLSQADAQLQEQEALAEQAVADWKSLGRRGQPSSLTLREPQLAAARANRDAAEAQVQRAQLDVDRTTVVAPYKGVVLERNVDPGQFVARGASVGRIHSIEAVDVRLPLTSRQLTYLDLNAEPKVELKAQIGQTSYVWAGKLIRTEGVDANTQQLNVIARIDNPYTQEQVPLRVGQFVQALVEGQVLEDVFVIPRSALREEREVLIIDENRQMRRRAVSVAWSDETLSAINQGLSENDLLVTTPLNTVADGTPVRATIDGTPPAPLEKDPAARRKPEAIN